MSADQYNDQRILINPSTQVSATLVSRIVNTLFFSLSNNPQPPAQQPQSNLIHLQQQHSHDQPPGDRQPAPRLESNIYLLTKSLYLKQHSATLRTDQLTEQFLHKDQEIVVSMKDINLLHQDLDFWSKESMAAIYSFDFKNLNPNKHRSTGQGGQHSNDARTPKKNLLLRAKQEYINKNLQSFLLHHSQNPNIHLTPYNATSLPEKIKKSFCLYNRTPTQNRLHTTTNFQLYCGKNRQLDKILRQQQLQKQGLQSRDRHHSTYSQINIYSGEDANIISNHLDNSKFQQLYQQKLEACKQIAHSYVFSGYGYRRYVSHGFDMEMRFYRAYLASMMRVVFRQLEKYVFESQTYKKLHNIAHQDLNQQIYQPPEDSLPNNPRERVPYKQFQCVIRPLYHVDKNFEKEIVDIWHKIFRVTFNLDQSTLQSQQTQGKQLPLVYVQKAQDSMTQEQVVECYSVIRQRIKQIVNQRMISDMKRMGLSNSQLRNVHRKNSPMAKVQGIYQEEGQMYDFSGYPKYRNGGHSAMARNNAGQDEEEDQETPLESGLENIIGPDSYKEKNKKARKDQYKKYFLGSLNKH